ncbi:MAG: sigma-54 dependent transcriptional regulator [Myxococcota bacterium]|nr:sigma-54 dependent transcriptional regulator [Myxococcota bacterium]
MSNSNERILVVDDEPNMRKVLSTQLKRAGFEVASAEDGKEAQQVLQRGGIDLLMTDIRMPRMDGLELLAWARQEMPDVPVVVITAHGTVDTAVQAMKDGAFDFVSKPFDAGQLVRTVRKALDQAQSMRSLVHAGADPARIKILGESPAASELRDWISKVADLPANILLTGEPGTGHEVVAQAIHEASGRRDAPFIKINCGAIPEDWVESELFGHEADAIVGAISPRPGRFELADGGTLFLDEIDKLPKSAQSRIVQVLDEKSVTRLGSLRARPLDFRLIAGSMRDLESDARNGEFREDLLYALNVASHKLRPLRDRLEDLLTFVQYYIARFNARLGRHVASVSPEAMLFADNSELTVAHLPDSLGDASDQPIGDFDSGMKSIVRRATARIERELIKRALDENSSNITHAAKQLNISRKSLQTKMRDLGLRDQES